ncbi:MAG: hypothetical protein U1F66_03705 [bacterium]
MKTLVFSIRILLVLSALALALPGCGEDCALSDGTLGKLATNGTCAPPPDVAGEQPNTPANNPPVQPEPTPTGGSCTPINGNGQVPLGGACDDNSDCADQLPCQDCRCI